jgi:hypothetical protein
MSVRNSDAPIRSKATRDQWMLDYWSDISRHVTRVETRPVKTAPNHLTLPPAEFPEYRVVCSCGWQTDTPFKRTEPCPVGAALRERHARMVRDRARRIDDLHERPRREWKAVDL